MACDGKGAHVRSVTDKDVRGVHADTDPVHLVLHALRIKGMASALTLDIITALGEHTVTQALQHMEAAGHAAFVERGAMWRLTPEGRDHHRVAVASFLGDHERREFAVSYERFLVANEQFKRSCSEWQVRDGTPNGHDDKEYDAAIIARIGALHGEVAEILDSMSSRVRHLGRYRRRLGEALTAVHGGDLRRVSGFGCESFHEIWMELHEDLIQLLDIDRAAEGSS